MMDAISGIRKALGDTLFYFAFSPAIKILVLLFLVVLPIITYLVLAERKILGYMQARVGPNRVGPWGILQPIADVMKLLVKGDNIPNQAVKWAFILAPCLVVGPALIIFAVVPFGPAGDGGGLSWVIADVNAGLLFVIAVATIGVYGLILGGWSSNNKFSLMGGLRSAAQMISYEVPQGLSLVGVLILAGTMSLVGIVEAQRDMKVWFVFPQLVGFFIYMVAGVAESNRNPFDLPEAESELVAGFHTEYSGMRFALFFLGEYANMIVISAVATTLFLGGWLAPFPNLLPFLSVVPGPIWFLLKVFVFLFVYIWFRGTFPRYRFDQLMDLGWKWMIPLALANLAITAAIRLWLIYPR
ncbi:MAG: NADH-quinone oxidoreductase subunit [Acidobacteriota bacterium]|jgi:NADH-quinone oxidoreductase subunit H|nr:NADH-quinone oxidoreductase subunit [Acidobacteriota bacterium]